MNASKKAIIFILFIVCTAITYFSPQLGVGKSLEKNGAQTQLPQGDKPIFVEFYSNDCPTCQKMKPVVDAIKKEYTGKVEFMILDTDNPQNAELTDIFQVDGIPAFHLISSKMVVKTSHEGEISMSELKTAMDDLIATDKDVAAPAGGAAKEKAPKDS